MIALILFYSIPFLSSIIICKCTRCTCICIKRLIYSEFFFKSWMRTKHFQRFPTENFCRTWTKKSHVPTSYPNSHINVCIGKKEKIIISIQMPLTTEERKKVLFTSKIIMKPYIWYWLSFISRKNSFMSVGLYICIHLSNNLRENLHQMIKK
jgi:hypothetical protein